MVDNVQKLFPVRTKTFVGAVSESLPQRPNENSGLIALLAQEIANEAVVRMAEKLRVMHAEPLVYSIAEAASLLGLSVSTLKVMVSGREIAVVRRGSRVLITRRAIENWINHNET